jgi:hypothetical protein
MKKILTLLMIFLVAQNINSQQSEFVVEHCVDYSRFQSTKSLICSNELKTKWFTMSPTYITNTTIPVPNGVACLKLNLGKSNENDKIVIRFSGDKTVVLKAYDINPEYGGITSFYASVADIHVFQNYELKSIKYVNGFEELTFTYYPVGSEKTFFINLFTKFTVKNVNCGKK